LLVVEIEYPVSVRDPDNDVFVAEINDWVQCEAENGIGIDISSGEIYTARVSLGFESADKEILARALLDVKRERLSQRYQQALSNHSPIAYIIANQLRQFDKFFETISGQGHLF
jgi:hypothetical protein